MYFSPIRTVIFPETRHNRRGGSGGEPHRPPPLQGGPDAQPASTATPPGPEAPLMKLRFTFDPSRSARPIVLVTTTSKLSQ
jgi:hypothetical protein